MSPNPFENEPGFENVNSEEDKKQQKEYIAKVRIILIKAHILLMTVCRSGMRLYDYQSLSEWKATLAFTKMAP